MKNSANIHTIKREKALLEQKIESLVVNFEEEYGGVVIYEINIERDSAETRSGAATATKVTINAQIDI